MMRVLTVILVGALLLGCPLIKDAGNGSSATGGGNAGGDSSGTGGAGGAIDVQKNNTGMSDPSKCNNLPPQQMADCLDEAMGN